MNKRIHQLVKDGNDFVITLRRHFRTFPETGGEEVETQKKIIAELIAMGLSPRSVAGTGVIVDIIGGQAGKTVAIRADIDALPIQDEIDKPYRSQNAGCCHACGHDGHTAVLLGIAKVFSAIKGELTGTIRLLFQPSEEKLPGGALAMIAAGAVDGVDAVIGTHLWQPLQVGTMGLTYGPLMASPDKFTITVKGSGGHGSMPHQTIDPLSVGAQIVLALKTITGNNVAANELAVLSVGVFKAGDAFNVIPDSATLQGTVRSFSQNTRETIFACIDRICRGICAAAGATYSLESVYGFPPVINNPEVAKVVAQSAEDVLGKDAVIEMKPVMVGEDFAYYQQKVPGCFMCIGVGNKEKGIVYPHHHPKFDMDESGFSYAVEIMAVSALNLLN
ncbi:M20 metallopeptidase family protein [Sporomusa acidovorans]|uniref:N-acetyldiaminopimelate deacetylase n=1 Tax=Sporomusa acidovorans (strain ATCC 49682 / DSM 3132 / Mol) TaxID=1123286 RepID=A0ABZ3J4U5_SPOA4|nr:amidohydrolase [Sporomusa acidovorans]OZC15486.1 N-acyl-L-amino acid amidohydrolase [Sporomusa acidovorans DSM 3132]SDE15953.1 amidohydrolase [Sporomusa acidovorans]